MDKERRDRFGTLGQWFGGVMGGIGLGYEIATGAPLGFTLITAGSLLYAFCTKWRKD